METFLQKLPVNVIRNGCIIDIRQGLANLLQGATVRFWQRQLLKGWLVALP